MPQLKSTGKKNQQLRLTKEQKKAIQLQRL